ncbi:hypothetical protein NQ315_016450 [Exocentrus adspersus]|uniref:Putative nuclease HARBI1 n=1 Tax=Exocentrus adspersus TaxID=1586481 RepID=A0AAV8V5Q7_9CUCU|nr:hypothetical protein NQ315_016450 [Exocentrus adspersus]
MWSSSSNSDEDENVVRVPYRFRERHDFAFLSDQEFIERFRLNRAQFQDLLRDLYPVLQNHSNRWYGLQPSQKMWIALHWLGNGGQYHGVCDMHGVSKMTVCRCVHDFVDAVNQIKFNEVVSWPANTLDIIQGFHAMAGMPEVCGVIDGTLIKIDAPSINEAAYVDRHGKHSINCMAVCGPDMKFYYVSANWPGSVHDARVLRNSSLCRRMENGWRPHPNAVILGDSAYPLKEWLIPPTYEDALNPAQTAFNRAHKRTRRIIENAFGILKEKFPCLNHLRVNPVFAGNIFKCCVTLCNICKPNDGFGGIDQPVEDHGVDVDNAPNPEEEDPLPAAAAAAGGQARLQQFINHFRV